MLRCFWRLTAFWDSKHSLETIFDSSQSLETDWNDLLFLELLLQFINKVIH